ncbi:MAG: hypothetical protein HW380_1737 [Magnetococcales bacterium]|nr:hypothetical protein [Magnetococcales bacterium]
MSVKSIILCEDFKELATLWPNGVAPNLFPVDPVKFRQLFAECPVKKDAESLKKLRKRMPDAAFWPVLAGLHVLLGYGKKLFPGFACVYGEFVRDEWLSLMGYHKDFHRDHVVHQPQEALVVKKLLQGLEFDGINHPLSKEMLSATWLHPSGSKKTKPTASVSLWDLSAFVLSRGGEKVRYLIDYARDLDVDPLFIKPQTPMAFRFWRGVVYDAAITAALFHDIGYPVQFLRTVAKGVNKGRISSLLTGGDDMTLLDQRFADPLFRFPFRGYRSQRSLPLNHHASAEEREALQAALKDSHGLPGAITFLDLNHHVMAHRSPRTLARGRLVLEMAATAIVMHDMQQVFLNRDDKPAYPGQARPPLRPYLRVEFLRDPVSFIVTLADQIQNYGRFSAKFFDSSKKSVRWEPDQAISGCCVQSSDDGDFLKLTMIYDPDHTGAFFLQMAKFNPEAQANFFHSNFGYLDYAGLYDQIILDAARAAHFCSRSSHLCKKMAV